MAITNLERIGIEKVVIALFNAAPGATYLAEFTASYEANGRNLSVLADGLAQTTTFKNLYPNFQTATEFATSILATYSLQASADAIAFVTGLFNAGVSKGQIALRVAVAIDSSTSTDPALVAAKAILANKAAVADNYSAVLNGNALTLAALQNTIASVTADVNTVTTANAANANGAGLTFGLTTGADNFTGSSANDLFNAVAGTGATLSAGDILSGGAGIDTLSVVTDAGFTLVGSNITSVERIQVNATAAAAVTFSNVSGVTDLVNNASSAALTFGVGAAGSVNNVVNLTVNGATAATTVLFSDTALAGSADAMTLTATNYGTTAALRTVTLGAVTAAANELESLTINTTGANAITLATDATQTSLKTLTINGAGALNIGLTADKIQTSATVINAAGATGGIVIGGDTGTSLASVAGTVALGAAAHNVTLGTGNDFVYFGANLGATDTVDGGTGIDTIGVTAAVTNAALANVKNVEALRFDFAGADITQDAGISGLTGYNYSLVSSGQTLTLNNLANSTTTTIIGGAATTTALTEVLKDSSGLADVLNVAISNGQSNAVTTLTTLTNITGLETLNLSSIGGTGTNVITADNVTAAHVITGSAGLTITNALATTSVNASAFTGKLTVTAGATGTNIQGGTAADTITGGVGNDTIVGGAGNDTINFGSTGVTAFGADVVAGGTGNDIFNFTATEGASGGITSYATFATITDFTVGTVATATDFLQFSGANTNLGATGGAGAATGLAKGNTVQGLTAGDAMVVQSVVKDAAAAALTANVSVIKLATGVAFTTDIFTTAKAAIGTASITGLGADSVYLVSFYDTTNSKAVIVTANTGTSAGGDTALSTGDFATGAAVHVVGVINMTAADYALFGATNFAVASA